MPAYNEEESIGLTFERLERTFAGTPYAWELVFVNDGSTDRTLQQATGYRPTSFRMVVVDLSRNFGKEPALSAGLRAASGDAVIPLDADLQDPPELLLQMIARWENGAEVVVAKRSNRSSDSWGKRVSASLFYRTFNMISDVPIPENVGDFRLMDRAVVDAINNLPENRRFMKGLFAWAGFRTEELEYVRPARAAGQTKFNGLRLIGLAMEGVTSFSTAPLRLVTYVGGSVAIAAILYGTFIVMRTLVLGIDLPGFASEVSLIAFLSGIQLLGLGIVGEYVGRTYIESKSRPPYVVRKVYRSDAD
ncbi:MAG: glycosyltransferase family 2 protein [Pseudomonadota bacterium]|jgi:glycosyltransferase involved in cell wall biosynthesis|nr:glycosyltransferase family 2 protein [Xanthomonadaceae bacterium]MDE2247838.1 glycosyltransferase family 2 protein [Xanthomonadaceae bacterium]MDE3210981.1 glycosyltransferase family 2 protein [Pseudomonadota bacterium]